MSESYRRLQIWTSMSPSEFVDAFLVGASTDPNVRYTKAWAYVQETGQEVSLTSGSHVRRYAPISVGSDPQLDLSIADEWIDRASRRSQLVAMGSNDEAERLLSEAEIEVGNASFVERLISDSRNTHGVFVELLVNSCILFWSPGVVYRVESAGTLLPGAEERLARISELFWPALEPLLERSGVRIERRVFESSWDSKPTDQHFVVES